jgi:hypothetical protein
MGSSGRLFGRVLPLVRYFVGAALILCRGFVAWHLAFFLCALFIFCNKKNRDICDAGEKNIMVHWLTS